MANFSKLRTGLFALLVLICLSAPMVYADDMKLIDAETDQGTWVAEGSDWIWKDANSDTVTNTLLKYKGYSYYLKEDGKMATGWNLLDGEKRYFFNWGGMVCSSILQIDGEYYSFDSDGNITTSWVQKGADWYYFGDDGKMVRDAFVDYLGYSYYLNKDGKMAVGWNQLSGKWYFFKNWGGMEKNAFYNYKGYTYYSEKDGIMLANGWNQIDADWYYFYPWGGMYQQTFIFYKGYTYFVGQDGKMATGWMQIDNDLYYFLPWGGGAKGTVTVPVTPDGDALPHTYSFTGDGLLIGKPSDYVPQINEKPEQVPTEEPEENAEPDQTPADTPTDTSDPVISDYADSWEVVQSNCYSVVRGEITDVSVVREETCTEVLLKLLVQEDIAGAALAGQEIQVGYLRSTGSNGGLIGFPKEIATASSADKTAKLYELSEMAKEIDTTFYDKNSEFWDKRKIISTELKRYTIQSQEKDSVGTYILPEIGMSMVVCLTNGPVEIPSDRKHTFEECLEDALNGSDGDTRYLEVDYPILDVKDVLFYQITDTLFCRSSVMDKSESNNSVAQMRIEFVNKDTLYRQFQYLVK